MAHAEFAFLVGSFMGLLVAVGSAIWIGIDVNALRRQLGGEKIAGMGTTGWVLCALGLWIVTLPYYLAKRSEIVGRLQPLGPARSEQLGTDAPGEMQYCRACGHPGSRDARFCRQCGQERMSRPEGAAAPVPGLPHPDRVPRLRVPLV